MNSSTGTWTVTAGQYKYFQTKVTDSVGGWSEIAPELRAKLCDYLVDGSNDGCLDELGRAYEQLRDSQLFAWTNAEPVTEIVHVQRRMLARLFEIERVAAGYYRRLGLVADQIPAIKSEDTELDRRLPGWLQNLIVLRSRLSPPRGVGFVKTPSFDFRLQPFLRDLEDGPELTQLIELVLEAESGRDYNAKILAAASDWGAILERFPEHTSAALRSLSAAACDSALRWLERRQFAFLPILPTIADLAVGSSKTVRQMAQNILRSHAAAARPLLSDRLNTGSTTQRAAAAESLVAILGPAAAAELAAALNHETVPRNRQLLQSLLASVGGETFISRHDDRRSGVAKRSVTKPRVTEPSGYSESRFAPIEMPSGATPLPARFAEMLWDVLQAEFKKQEEKYEQDLALYLSPQRPMYFSRPTKPEQVERHEFDEAIAFISGTTEACPSCTQRLRAALRNAPKWEKWAGLDKLELLQVVRFLFAFGLTQKYRADFYRPFGNYWLDSHRAAQRQRYGLREVAAAFATLPGYEGIGIALAYLTLNTSRGSTLLAWEPEAVWPLFVEYRELLRDAILGVRIDALDSMVTERQRTALQVAAMMPELPHEIEQALWHLALGENRKLHAMARQALRTSKQRLPRALAALEDGRKDVRLAAAEMLVELRDTAAIPVMKKAAAKEQQEQVKALLMQAIDAAGGAVNEFVGRDGLLKEAQLGLKKTNLRGMEWLSIDDLPKVHWREDNSVVAREMVRWWVVQSLQLKSPVAGPALRLALGMCRKSDIAALARYVLAQWIDHDTKELGRRGARGKGKSRANMSSHSATSDKGVLAIVSVGGDGSCVKMISRYLRRHGTSRMAQGKAMLEALAWIQLAEAEDLLLWVAGGLRENALRKRARELVQDVAVRQGWTADQLEDRTIPHAGFERSVDAQGRGVGEHVELLLDYGPRKIAVVLGEELRPLVLGDDGKSTQKMLPRRSGRDHYELVELAGKAYFAAKNTVKEVVQRQTERLRESARSGHSWSAEEWQRFFVPHPIMSALCRRVLWMIENPDRPATAIGNRDRYGRLTPEGVLVDVHSNPMILQPRDRLRVADWERMNRVTREAWEEHLRLAKVARL
jgi:hypothetical protein